MLFSLLLVTFDKGQAEDELDEPVVVKRLDQPKPVPVAKNTNGVTLGEVAL